MKANDHLSIPYLINLFKRGQSSKRDCTLVIDGFVGEGKTTFAIQCLKAYYDIQNVTQFRKHAEKYMVYNRAELYKLATEETEKMIIADEAINVLFRREWMKEDQIVLLKAFDVCRSNRNIFVFNIPNFWSLDSHTVQTRIRYWAHVDKQKWVMLFRPIRHPFVSDVWCKKVNEKIHEYRMGIKRSPNFIDTFTFGPLTDREYDILDEIKNQKRLNIEADDKPKEVSLAQVAAYIKKRNPNVTTSGIAQFLQARVQNVHRALKVSAYHAPSPREGTP